MSNLCYVDKIVLFGSVYDKSLNPSTTSFFNTY